MVVCHGRMLMTCFLFSNKRVRARELGHSKPIPKCMRPLPDNTPPSCTLTRILGCTLHLCWFTLSGDLHFLFALNNILLFASPIICFFYKSARHASTRQGQPVSSSHKITSSSPARQKSTGVYPSQGFLRFSNMESFAFHLPPSNYLYYSEFTST